MAPLPSLLLMPAGPCCPSSDTGPAGNTALELLVNRVCPQSPSLGILAAHLIAPQGLLVLAQRHTSVGWERRGLGLVSPRKAQSSV